MLILDTQVLIDTIDRVLVLQNYKRLNALQIEILRGALSGATYEEIARQSRWSEAHVKSIGASLWELLTDVFQEDISKRSLPLVIKRRLSDLQLLDLSQATSLEFPDGPVGLTSQYYCDRPPSETNCYAAIAQAGALIRIRAAHQMGKTSLLYRVLHHGEQLGYISVCLNFKLVDQRILQDLDRFLRWFCARVTQKLNIPIQLSDYWDDIFGSKTSCKDYFERYILPRCQQPLVLALDDVDTLFAYPATADGFFALLRAWYEDAKNMPLWAILRLVLVHSTDTYIPLNIHQSPFNVGIPIKLPEFNEVQIHDLARRHGLFWQPDDSQKLMALLSGHPYLIRVALYQMAQASMTLDDVLNMALNVDAPFYAHLQQQLVLLKSQPNLMMALKSLLTDPSSRLHPSELFQLTRIGLITMQQGQICIRCELYRHWFQAYL